MRAIWMPPASEDFVAEPAGERERRAAVQKRVREANRFQRAGGNLLVAKVLSGTATPEEIRRLGQLSKMRTFR